MQSKFRILDARYGRPTNELKLGCKNCGAHFWHKANRWHIHCPRCEASGHLSDARRAYLAKE